MTSSACGARSGATPASSPRRRTLPGVVLVLVLAVTGLVWAKWLPYVAAVVSLAGTGRWTGESVLRAATDASSWWQGAWAFTLAYGQAVWKAVLVGLVLAAAVELAIPRRWLAEALSRRGAWLASTFAGAASLPSMMCSCCTAPLPVSLRRSGVPVGPATAYWLGNPVLNPAVLVFLGLIGPWQWAVVRILVGAALVVGAGVVVGRMTGEAGRAVGPADSPAPAPAPGTARGASRRPDRNRLRPLIAPVVLVGEYAVVVFALGAGLQVVGWQRNWPTLGLWGLVAVTLIATLMVVPTGGEIPVALALAAGGAGPWAVGVVLIALPAVNLASMVMLSRTLSWRAVTATAGMAALAGLAGGALLAASA